MGRCFAWPGRSVQSETAPRGPLTLKGLWNPMFQATRDSSCAMRRRAMRNHGGLTPTTMEHPPAVMALHVSKTAAALYGPKATYSQRMPGKQHDGRGSTV